MGAGKESTTPLKKRGVHWYLTDEEVEFFRNHLNSLRRPEVYEPGRWFVSYLNRKPEALGLALPNHMPPSVILRDITLRTIEQTPGVSVTMEERKRLARALIEVGVEHLQLALLGRTMYEDDFRALAGYIKQLNRKVEIEAAGGDTIEGIDRLAACRRETGSDPAGLW